MYEYLFIGYRCTYTPIYLCTYVFVCVCVPLYLYTCTYIYTARCGMRATLDAIKAHKFRNRRACGSIGGFTVERVPRPAGVRHLYKWNLSSLPISAHSMK